MGLNIGEAAGQHMPLEDITPKPAVIVGLDRARANRRQRDEGSPPRRKRPSERPPAPLFSEDATRQVDADSALAQLLRKQSRQPDRRPQRDNRGFPPASPQNKPYMVDDEDPTHLSPFDEPTRAVNPDEMFRTGGLVRENPAQIQGDPTFEEDPTKAIDVSRLARPQKPPPRRKKIRYPKPDEEATRAVNIENFGRGPGRSDIDWDLD